MHRRRNVHFERVSQDDDRSETDGPDIFNLEKKNPIPYKTILMAVFMFVAGVMCLLFAAVIYFGAMEEKYQDRMIPSLLIGSVLIIPGAYYTFTFVCILLKVPGYSFEIFERFE